MIHLGILTQRNSLENEKTWRQSNTRTFCPAPANKLSRHRDTEKASQLRWPELYERQSGRLNMLEPQWGTNRASWNRHFPCFQFCCDQKTLLLLVLRNYKWCWRLTWQMLVPDSPRDIWRHNNNSHQDPDFIVTRANDGTNNHTQPFPPLPLSNLGWPPGGEIIEERKLIWWNKNIFLGPEEKRQQLIPPG